MILVAAEVLKALHLSTQTLAVTHVVGSTVTVLLRMAANRTRAFRYATSYPNCVPTARIPSMDALPAISPYLRHDCMAGRSAFPLDTNRTQEPLSDAYGIGCAKGGKLQLRVHFKKSGHEKKGGIINAQPLPSLASYGNLQVYLVNNL